MDTMRTIKEKTVYVKKDAVLGRFVVAIVMSVGRDGLRSEVCYVHVERHGAGWRPSDGRRCPATRFWASYSDFLAWSDAESDSQLIETQ